MKVLFVTHDISNYGASKSLQTLIRILSKENIYCELVVRRRILGKHDYNEIRERFGVGNVHGFWLPFWNCFVGRKHALTIKETIWLFINNFLSRGANKKIIELAKKRNVDVVHLNSVVLIDMISHDGPFIVHVRELVDSTFDDSLSRKIRAASGVIFIDNVVSKPFENFEVRNSLVLKNPFDLMSNPESLRSAKFTSCISRINNKYVIAIIGYVKDEKGINFIIDFLKINNDKRFVILVVGHGDLFDTCKNFERIDPRLIVYGEEEDISIIYKNADLVIRGEDVPRLGRTVYEAIYYGANVLIPGQKANYPSDLFEKYSEHVYLYNARDLTDFSKQVTELVSRGKTERKIKHPGQYDIKPLIDIYNRAVIKNA